ncbi:MAG: DUF1552 domain-containing protein [Planctomycetaceae bacterium]
MNSRRRFLRGTGVALSLPWLESLQGAGQRSPGKPPLRSAFLHFPNGAWMEDWTPATVGRDYVLSRTLQPLQPVREELLVLSGLDKLNSQDGGGHYSATANYLTGMPVRRTTGKDLSAGGISVDQLLAKQLIGQTPVPALVMSCDPVQTGVDRITQYTLLYDSLISWEAADRPVMPLTEPRAAFEQLFSLSASDVKQRNRSRRLLNLVLEDAHSLRAQLGRDDRSRIEQYLDSLNAIESRLLFFDGPPADFGRQSAVAHALEQRSSFCQTQRLSYQQQVRLLLDLVVLAFQGDATRVVSLMMANEATTRSFEFIGVSDAAHRVSHHQGDPGLIAAYQQITQWFVQQFADLVLALQQVPEGEGTLLDHCMLLFGSGLSDGNRHDPLNLPVLLAGRGGGAVPTGQHLRFTGDNTPLCNLYCSMLNTMGLPTTQFGDSNGQIF